MNGWMPHGHCVRWDPAILGSWWLGDGLMVGAYTTMAIVLLAMLRRPEFQALPVWLLPGAAALLVACASTHLAELYTIYEPKYAILGLVKVVAGIVSAWFAARLVRWAARIEHADALLAVATASDSLRRLHAVQALLVRAQADTEGDGVA